MAARAEPSGSRVANVSELEYFPTEIKKGEKKKRKKSYHVYCWVRIIARGRAASSPVQFHAADKLMALTFLFFIFSPSERKDYPLFDVNELCQRLVYRLRGQLLRRAAGFWRFFFFFFSYLQPEMCKHSQHTQVQSRHLSHLSPFFPFLCFLPSH